MHKRTSGIAEHYVLGIDSKRQTVVIEASSLSRHTAVFGSSGSGKTGAILGIAEKVIGSKVPTILVDIKGDLLNIALQPSNRPMNVRLVTPQGGPGEKVSILAGLNNPARLAKTVSLILEKVGLPSSHTASPHHAFMTAVVQSVKTRKVSLVDVIYGCTSGAVTHVGALPVDDFISKKQRTDLASRLNSFYTSEQMALYRDGKDLDVGSWLSAANGEAPVIVYGVSHIVQDDDRNFAVGLLLDAIVDWMRTQGGTQSTRLFVAVDECVGLLPPHPFTSPAKDAFLTILKQGRAFGVGLLVASQNPKDIDYKALANCNTWLCGTLRTSHDRSRVLEGASLAGATHEQTAAELAQLDKREFMLMTPDKSIKIRTRDTSCALIGPMQTEDVQTLYTSGMLKPVDTTDTYEQEYLEACAYYDANPCTQNKHILDAARDKLYPSNDKRSSLGLLISQLFT